MNKITDYAWLAGIIDGEGCLSIYKIKSKAPKGFIPKRGFTWRITGKVSNTNIKLMDKIRKIIGYNGCYSYFKHSKRPQEKGLYSFDFTPSVLRKILPLCIQFFTAKKQQALLLIEALSLCSLHTRKINNDKRMEEIYESIRKLNKRGI